MALIYLPACLPLSILSYNKVTFHVACFCVCRKEIYLVFFCGECILIFIVMNKTIFCANIINSVLQTLVAHNKINVFCYCLCVCLLFVGLFVCFLFRFVLCFVLLCFVLFCFVFALFCFVLFCFLFCFVRLFLFC